MPGSITESRRPGDLNDGLCYLVTLALDDALARSQKEQFSEKRRLLVAELAEAGQKGAREKMRDCSEKLETLFLREINPALDKGKGRESLLDSAGTWVELLKNTKGCFPLEFSLKNNHLHILMRWRGEQSLDVQMEHWISHFPHLEWSRDFYPIQVPEDRINDFWQFVEEEKGNTSPSLSMIEDASGFCYEFPEDFHHVTVLLRETVDALHPAPGKVIVDATLGGGGHTEKILETGASVIGIDQDPAARNATAKRLSRFGDRLQILPGNFREVASLLHREGITQVDGLLADIGVSSHQLDTPERGFSFRNDGPLDMRMSPELKLTAADLVNAADENELVRIFREYGEERAARPLARLIVKERKKAPITTTARFAALTEKAIPRRGSHHPGTKVFQALRIAVNDELGALQDLLEASVELLAPGGILAVITFHSLEDRCVKRFLDSRSLPEIDRPEWPAPRPNPEYHFNLVNKRPIIAGEEEVKRNPRSRSAKLRVAQRILQK